MVMLLGRETLGKVSFLFLRTILYLNKWVKQLTLLYMDNEVKKVFTLQ